MVLQFAVQTLEPPFHTNGLISKHFLYNL